MMILDVYGPIARTKGMEKCRVAVLEEFAENLDREWRETRGSQHVENTVMYVQ